MTQGRHHRWMVSLLVPALVAALNVPAGAQALSVDGRRFTVDGTPRFLTFISYFGAMGAANVVEDLRFVKRAGFDGIRLWPNSPDGPKLMNADGSLDRDARSRLLLILDCARDLGLVVDVTFTAEHVAGMNVDRYQEAIVAATEALRSHENLLFDLQNERNIYGPLGRPLATPDIAAIRAAVARADPSRLVTASTAGSPLSETARLTIEAGLDVTAYHDPRTSSWYQPDRIQSIVDGLAAADRPIYFQEPTRFPYPSTSHAGFFQQALVNARMAGAAAWCFHTDLSFQLQPPDTLFEALLRSRAQPEWSFVTGLRELIQTR